MASKKRAKRLTPRTARGFDDICKLPRDNWSYGDWWMMVTENGEIVITNQAVGEPSRASISIPRRVFNHFIDKYNGVQRRKSPTGASR